MREGKFHVLIVDSHQLVSNLYWQVVKGVDVSIGVHFAKSPNEVFRELRRNRIGLAIVEHRCDSQRGTEIIEQIYCFGMLKTPVIISMHFYEFAVERGIVPNSPVVVGVVDRLTSFREIPVYVRVIKNLKMKSAA